MTAIRNHRVATGTLLATYLALVACTPTNPAIDPNGTTYDGMVPVRDSGMKEAWVRPDINISSYRQVLVLPTEVQFRALPPGAGNSMSRDQYQEFPLTPANQTKLVDTVTDVFREELAKSPNLTLATGPGPDVLLVRISLLDIVSRVPPEGPIHTEIFLDEIGAATLVLELQDSTSGETLARAVDRRAADPVEWARREPGEVTRINAVTAWSEVRRVARRWASVATLRIDQLYTRGQVAGQPTG